MWVKSQGRYVCRCINRYANILRLRLSFPRYKERKLPNFTSSCSFFISYFDYLLISFPFLIVKLFNPLESTAHTHTHTQKIYKIEMEENRTTKNSFDVKIKVDLIWQRKVKACQLSLIFFYPLFFLLIVYSAAPTFMGIGCILCMCVCIGESWIHTYICICVYIEVPTAEVGDSSERKVITITTL